MICEKLINVFQENFFIFNSSFFSKYQIVQLLRGDSKSWLNLVNLNISAFQGEVWTSLYIPSQTQPKQHKMSNLFFFLFFFSTSLLEYNCSTMVHQFMLYNKVNKPNVYTYPHIPSLLCLPPTLPIPPFQVVTKHRADLPVLCSCL